MELLVKIVNDFKLCTIIEKKKLHCNKSQVEFTSDYNNSNVSYGQKKELYHDFLEWWLLLPSQDFTCSKATMEKLKKLE